MQYEALELNFSPILWFRMQIFQKFVISGKCIIVGL